MEYINQAFINIVNFFIWLKKPEILISALGWIATYWFVVRAQKKQHKNEINHEVYKELIESLDQYAAELSEFSNKLQAFHFISTLMKAGIEEKPIREWTNDVRNIGSEMKFHLFLQKWESYEIFLQNLNTVKTTFNNEQKSVMQEFYELLLFQDPVTAIKKDKADFEKKLNKLWERTAELSIYILDIKIVLQNNFYKQYGLKKIPFRKPEDPKYKILTEKGLVKPKKLAK